ncbi:MAG: PTS sugar transporter subunit IIA [Gemmatimonadales bacterium]
MSQLLRGAVVCHGELAAALVSAVESVSGVLGALVPISNEGCDKGRLQERVAAALPPGPGILFVDMPAGSCLLAAVRQLAGREDVRVITGVNLAMLVEFVFRRDQPLDEAVRRIIDTGARAVGVR